MSGSELAARVREALEVDAAEFDARVADEAERLKAAVHEGTFDNAEAIVGLELELYAVDARTGGLRRMPRHLLELIGFEKELGLHNAEMQTSPQPFNEHGLAVQERELAANLVPAMDRVGRDDFRLVSDGMLTVPPRGETATDYLRDSVEEDGIRIAANMSDAVRYHAMANTDYAAGMRIEAPHVSLQADTVMPESLITSIQPHYQVAHAPNLPEYFRYALRIAAPLLALGVNSPFFPPDLYDDADRSDKVGFPPDFEHVDEAIDAVVADDAIVPTTVETGRGFDEAFTHFQHKHGSYWRWVRPVFEGGTRSAANARIEFRPLPAQPTLRDAVSFQAVFAGLMELLPQAEHPVRGLDWETARENFYAASREGLRADIEWITSDGVTTTATDRVFSELFEGAREGLESRGLSTERARRYIRPLRERVDRRTTPARWKHDHVAAAVDRNTPLPEAVWAMQSTYVDNQAETLFDGTFADWL
ncbi:hypothetical protein BRC67_11575 [Halobacteriales archaeon QH_3_68_24]|nr:MAG: hypothetical protein BRC67_11575 [Halobacteriales archaeon QH_3_68_24]